MPSSKKVKLVAKDSTNGKLNRKYIAERKLINAYDKAWKDLEKFESELEVPTLRRLPSTRKMLLVDKITWVLTAVNVAIFISLVIRNI